MKPKKTASQKNKDTKRSHAVQRDHPVTSQRSGVAGAGEPAKKHSDWSPRSQRSPHPDRPAQRPRAERQEREDRVSPFAPRTFMVDGLAAVAEYIRFSPDRVQEIQCVEKQRPAILKLLEEYDVKVPIRQRDVDKDENTAPVAARVELKAIEFNAMLARFKSRQPKIILALDHITDPRNLGAIVRSAAFFGVREVLVPERRQVLLTQAAVNTAQGGFALTDLVVTVNLTRALTALKEQGYWVIGATMNGESFTKLSGVYERTVLVMGSEDTGLSKQIIETCDRLASIAAPHSDYLTEPSRGLDSLNVSVAAGIFLCEFTKKPNATP